MATTTTKCSTWIYDDFLAATKQDERAGQREAVRLLVELSDGSSTDAYAIQAPTGTGKSYAALLAGVHNAQRGLRTIIGTSTVVLSDQYARDIRVVHSAFPDVRFCVLKGATNYYCGNKAADKLRKTKHAGQLKEARDLLSLMARGLLDRIPYFCQADTDYCKDCTKQLREKGKTTCEYAKARALALQADVVVTTHAMISVDARIRTVLTDKEDGTPTSAILGKIHLTVFDEAHKASESLVYGSSLSSFAINKLVGFKAFADIHYRRVDEFMRHMNSVNEADWYDPKPEMARELLRLWFTKAEITAATKRMEDIPEPEHAEGVGYLVFLNKARIVLEEIADGDNSGGVSLWATSTKHKDGTYSRTYRLKEMTPDAKLVERMKSQRTAWLSATIGTESKKTYSLDKCGIKPEHFELESPFDYTKQLSWVLRSEKYSGAQGDFVASVHNHWPGGTAVLTPFHKRKEKITDALRSALPGTLVQQQSSGSSNKENNAAVAAHCDVADSGGNPVLVGVEIFSTGIDLPGDRLTKLVLAELFPLRDDWAYIMWRSRWIESFGGDAFRDFVLPERAIVLEQQIGRVIRRTDDKGVVIFYLADKDCKPGSQGQQIIEEALRRFPGAQKIG